jgi:hypothetical protein
MLFPLIHKVWIRPSLSIVSAFVNLCGKFVAASLDVAGVRASLNSWRGWRVSVLCYVGVITRD